MLGRALGRSVLLAVAVLAAVPRGAAALDSTADRVLGQVGFTHRIPNLVDARGLDAPFSAAVDTSIVPNRVYVTDTNNNRVLGWADVSAYVNGAPADLVIGQPDFFSSDCNGGGVSATSLCFPIGVAVDGAGNVYVADYTNSRVLEYDTPFATDATADAVFGQGGSFTSADCNLGGVSATSLCNPTGVAVDGAGNLYVADGNNSRVLEYTTPLVTDTTADVVFGQGGSFTSGACNLGGVSAMSLCSPYGITVDGAGNLYVADDLNSRVLEYDTPLATDTTADVVFGQGGSFTSGACNLGGVSATSLCNSTGVAVDGAGNVYVADYVNNRVLGYDTPLATDTTADVVFGQGGSFTGADCNLGGVSATSLCNPTIVSVDGAGNLYVADGFNNRVLEYGMPLATDTTADVVFGQVGFTHGTPNLVDARGLFTPYNVAVDTSTVPNRVYVADTNNSRVLAWADVTAYVNGAPADLVIGQPDFFSSDCNSGGVSATSLCYPDGVAVDGAGNVYVVDSGNSRVLEYATPFTTDTTADAVFGQGGSFTSADCNLGGVSATSLCNPFGAAVDGAGNLYVGDSNNSRVLEYDTPLITDTTADAVFGQGGSFTSADCNPAGVSATSLCYPFGVAVDGGDLYVADSFNNRVLEYTTPLTTDTTADAVFGQGGSFTSADCNPAGVSATSLCNPVAVAVDGAGNLYVVDNSNNRVLEYDTPLATDTTADAVFGQGGSFTSADCNLGGVSATSLCFPNGVAVDGTGNLYVADTQNSRVLDFQIPSSCALDPDLCLDDFNCYKEKKVRAQQVYGHIHLADRFENAFFDVEARKGLCTPTNKNNEGLLDADTHMREYLIRASHGTPRFVKRLGLSVHNQLGSLKIDLIRRLYLMVPTTKSLVAPPPLPNPAAPDYEHFKCYKIRVTPGSPAFVPQTVTVEDQFIHPAIPYSVLKAKRLCVPVDKNGEGIVNPDRQLVCYKIRAGAPVMVPTAPVFTNNQFGPETVAMSQPEDLCIPSILQ